MNLVIFVSDQHNPHVLGSAGDRVVRTPHLDALSARGVTFRRAYCPSPLCVPSRMAFMTARYPSDIGVQTNFCTLGSDVPTFAHSLGTAGYETVLCGRMHFTGPDQRHGFERRLVGDISPQWAGGRGPGLGPIPLGAAGQSRVAVTTAGPGLTSYQAYDRAVTDAATAWLRGRARRTGDRPFCLVVGAVLPHCPFVCPKELFDEYYPQVTVPRLSEAEKANLHPALAAWRKQRGIVDLPDDVLRTARAAYYGLVTLTDALVGEVLAEIRSSGLSEDTAFFYTSDHGDMAGEHEMWWKSCFYEGSVGTPLIGAWPGRFRQNVNVQTPVSLLDLAATIVALADAEALPDMRGKSLTDVLEGREDMDAARPVYAEGMYQPGEPPARMVVRGPWKLVHYDGYDAPLLFNLDEDPDELLDRGRDPACADIRRGLRALALEGWSAARVREDVRRNFERHRFLSRWAEAVHPGDPDHWVEPEGCNVFPQKLGT